MAGAVTSDHLVIDGLRELQRAFNKAGKEARTELRDELRVVAVPVARDAQTLALNRIRRMSLPWSEMRIGVTVSYGVYVAPKKRGVKAKRDQRLRRPNLAPLLLDRAMLPALERNRPMIERRFEFLMDNIGRSWERAA